MRSYLIGLCSLGLWASTIVPASAAWDNVFQPTLFGRSRSTTSSYYVAPTIVQSSPVVAAPVCNTCNAPPQTCTSCTTNYVARSYYQPVTTYQTQSYYEPVTTYQTSYYNEPVTSYRYSCYYDPTTCSYQQAVCPVTSYQTRAKSCPVQSWVQRCAQVPVTSYKQVVAWEPQTTCSAAPVCPQACPTCAPAPVAQQPACPTCGPSAPVGQTAQPISPTGGYAPSMAPAYTQPNITESRTPGSGTSNPAMYDRYYPRQQSITPSVMPPATYQQQQQTPVFPTQQQQATPPPPVKLERIVLGPDSRVEGQVVRSDNSPKSNARVMFVSATLGQRQTVTANSSGRFDVSLPTGNWLVYLYGADDLPIYNSRVDVGSTAVVPVVLVNR